MENKQQQKPWNLMKIPFENMLYWEKKDQSFHAI